MIKLTTQQTPPLYYEDQTYGYYLFLRIKGVGVYFRRKI